MVFPVSFGGMVMPAGLEMQQAAALSALAGAIPGGGGQSTESMTMQPSVFAPPGFAGTPMEQIMQMLLSMMGMIVMLLMSLFRSAGGAIPFSGQGGAMSEPENTSTGQSEHSEHAGHSHGNVPATGNGSTFAPGSGPINGAYRALRNATPSEDAANPFRNPLPSGSYRISQDTHGAHPGIDMGAVTGTDVMAAAPGRVIFAGRATGGYAGYGNLVIIQHENGYTTRYAHLSNITVQEGQTVDVGQQIGDVGSTGNSTGPHLHFEVRDANGTAIPPQQVLSGA